MGFYLSSNPSVLRLIPLSLFFKTKEESDKITYTILINLQKLHHFFMEKVQMDMEETRYHPLSNISVGMDRRKIKVRLTRKWNVVDQNILLDKQIGNIRIDMILIDETGVQVHATVLKRHAQSLSPLLQEGQVLHIENFSVTSVLNDYRPVRNKCRLFFNWDTIVKTINGIHSEIPMYGFDFLEFDDLATRFGDIRNCSNVYGRLTKISEVMETTGGTLREIYLDNGRSDDGKVELLIGSSSTQSNVEERSVRNRKTLSEIAAETTKVIRNKLYMCNNNL
ncbi:hypothetical protein IFM89_031156 [Coptis chinensis]|uniref:Replication protein A 70 kDa DNA-binding subunit B/D first OB fold domain-containing protein n=1 Tax=Coptis chinensis TaxID=261450 RepID=A0A835ISQ9_9MAGN|nr:hypothetical protein IFM89_031156 [Coptis chinensis]